MKNKFLKLLIMVSMLLGQLTFVHASVDEPKVIDPVYITYINPEYADLYDDNELEVQFINEVNYALDEIEYKDSYLDCVEELKEGFIHRESEIVIHFNEYDLDFFNTEGYFNVIFKELLDEIEKHTGVPNEGDYIGKNYAQAKGGMGGLLWSDHAQLDVTFFVEYRNTYQEELIVDQEVNRLKNEWDMEGKSDIYKVKTIYDYITHNVTYDDENLNDDSYILKYTAYAALMNRTAVCQGYALAFYRIALEYGIDTRYISGIGNGGAHGWDIVKIGDYYYNIDSTWDSSYVENNLSYAYFLKNMDDFDDHYRNVEFNTAQFHTLYPMSPTSYTFSGNPCEFEHIETLINVEDPTCTKDGYTGDLYCSRCDTILHEGTVIEAFGHKEVVDKGYEATCTNTGLTEGTHCSVCNVVLTAQEQIEALGHDEVVDDGYEATCTTTGLTEGTHCSRCNIVLVSQEVIPAKGHTVEIDESVEPTCTTTGLTEGTHCSICNEILIAQEKVEPLGHIEVIDEGYDATCINEGLTEGKHCERCHEVFTIQEIVPALGHDEIIIEEMEATCINEGHTQGIHCVRCNEVLIVPEILPALGHDLCERELIKATYTNPGLKEVYCSRCDYKVESIEIPQLISVYALGNITRDNDIDFVDAIHILKYTVSLIEIVNEQEFLGDVNKDGVINFADAILILQKDAGLIEAFN